MRKLPASPGSLTFPVGLLIGSVAVALLFSNYCLLFFSGEASIVLALIAFAAGLPWSVAFAAFLFIFDANWVLGVVGAMPCRGHGGGWPALEAVVWVPAMVGVFINAQIWYRLRAGKRAR